MKEEKSKYAVFERKDGKYDIFPYSDEESLKILEEIGEWEKSKLINKGETKQLLGFNSVKAYIEMLNKQNKEFDISKLEKNLQRDSINPAY